MANLQNEIVNFLKNISLRISGGLRVLHRLPVIPWVSVVVVAVIAGSLLTVVHQAQAANGIRKTINFQGKLVDDDGLNVANDDYTVVFTLYNDSSAGTNLWDETQTVSTVDGIFQVELGSVDTSLANVNFNSDQLWLGIKVGTDSEMTPRIRFTAVPYAFNAEKLNGVTATQSASGFTLSGGTSTVKTLTLNDNFTVNTAGLTFANAKTLGVNHSITLAGVDGTTITFQGSDTYVGRATSDELTNKSIGSTGLTFSGATTDITTGTNESFTIDMNGTGDLVINSDFDSGVSIGSASNTPAILSLSGGIGNNAAFIVNNTNSGDLFVASQAGTTKFRIANNGDLELSGGIYLGGSVGTGSQCLTGGAVASWGSCGTGSGSSQWQITNGLLYNGNLTTDFAIGGSTSESAKFKVSLSGTQPTASVAANTSSAGLLVDNRGVGDLFTASKGGSTKFVITNTGTLVAGPDAAGTISNNLLLPNTLAHFSGNVNGWAQVNAQNRSNGAGASTDYIATADNGSDSTNYIDFGINSSGYNDSNFTIGGANDGYLYNNGGNLAIGTQTSGKVIKFHTGGTLAANERMRIDGTGNVSIGTTTALATLDVRGVTATAPFASISGQSTFAGAIVDNTGTGDIFTASKSGATKFVIRNDGTIGFGSANYTSCGSLTTDASALLTCGTAAAGGSGDTLLGVYAITAPAGTNLTVNFNGAADSAVSSSSGTLTFPSNAAKLVVEMKAGGGGGGGVSGANATPKVAGGGGEGGYSSKVITSVASNYYIKVGGGGAGGTTSGTNGAQGTQTCLGTNATDACTSSVANATGGSGGTGSTGTGQLAGGAGGSGVNGDLPLTGAPGGFSSGATSGIFSGSGGGISGGIGRITTGNGNNGSNGGGGGGGYNSGNNNTATGGNGGNGYILIYLYKNAGGGTSTWTQFTGGVLAPADLTTDVLIGGNATASARFGILNIAPGGTPTASLSAGAAGGAYLTATGLLQTTANQTLTLGGTTTGNILLNPQGNNFVGIGTSTPLAPFDVRTSLRTGATASISARSTHAALFVDNTDSGDLFTASKSGATKFTVLNNGNVRINNLNSASCDVKADTTGLLSCGTDSSGGGVNHMNQLSGLTHVGNLTTDFAVGGAATSSAIFNVTGVNGGQGALGQFQTNAFALPTAEDGAGTAIANGYMYVVGGGLSAAAHSTVYYAKVNNDGSVDAFRSTSSLPAGRRELPVTALNGYVYAIGGADATGTVQTSVYVAKINSDGTLGSWKGTSALPQGRSGTTAVNANGYVYIVGGYDGTNTSRHVYYAKPNADGSISGWMTLTDSLPVGGRASGVGGIANGYMYLVGGDVNFAPDATVYFARINGDGTLGTWTSTQSLPTATAYHSTTVANGYIYAIGGTTNATLDDAVQTMYYARLLSNGAVGSWTTVTNALPAARTIAAVASANGYIYIVGGDSVSALDIGNPTTTIYYASTARVSMTANLDLIGMTTRSIASASAGTGGSIFAGNIFSNGALEVTGNAHIWNGLSIHGIQSLTGELNLAGTNGTQPAASISAQSTFAGLLVDNNGLGDLFTASKSGASKFTVLNSGDLKLGNYTTGGGLLYTTNTGTVVQTTAGGSGECLKSSGGSAPTWGTCGTGSSSNYWAIQNGLLYNGNLTTDFAIGGTSTNSAKFVFGGLNTNTPIATFSGTLMLGAKNNSTFTQQTTWDRISDTTAGTIATGGTTNIASISASISYNGSLYVGTYKDQVGSAEVYRYDGAPGAWTRVHSAAGTLASTTNIGSISAMTVFDGRLYVGTSKMNQAEVYRYEGGTTWSRVSFAAGQIKQNGTTAIDGVSSMAVFQGRLYAGTRDGARAELYRYESNGNWVVINNTPGTFVPTNSTGVTAVTAMVVKNGVLYIGVQKPGDADVLRYAGGQTFLAMNAATATGSYSISGTSVTAFDEVSAMTVYNGNVIVGLRKLNGAEVLVMNDTVVASGSAVDTWTRLNQAAGTITSGGTANIDGVSAMSVYNGMLYVGTSEGNSAEIYRYTGGEQKFLKVTQSSAGQIASGGSTGIDGVVSMLPSNEDLYIGTLEAGRAEVYKHTSDIDRSFGLEFQANPQIAGGEQNSIDNHASIFFLASASANLSSANGNTGAFVFSHGILTRTGSYDVAEDYPTRDDSLEPGDLVSIDRNERGFVTKSETAYDPNIIGVYSESPALRLSQLDSRIDGGRAIPIALAGRVPVKVSNENGPIKAGDFLTASSQPGIAMKATKSGVVIGQAMGGFSEDGVGKVTAYIKSATYQGSVASTFAGMETTPATGKELLTALASQTKPVSVSEVVTDQLVAGLRIVSPEVTADKLQINTIEPATGNDIDMLLSDEGTFSVKDASGEAGIVFKSSGDAAFAGHIDAQGLNVAGNVTADTIVAGKLVVSELEIPAEAWEAAFADGGLEALEARINNQESRITNLETLFASASALAATTVTPTPVATDSAIAILANMPTIEDFEKRDREVFDLINLPTDGLATYSGKITADKLHVAGSAIVEGILTVVDFVTTRNLIVDELATFLGKVVFSGDVFFQGRPTFNHDTAGIAIVKKGTDRVEVRFEKEYETVPMVNVNLTLDEVSPMPSEALESLTKRQKAQEAQVFESNVRYVVTKRTTKGFVILLDRKVDEDRAFSWIVVAVDNPVVHEGNGDNYQSVSGDIDKKARPISSSIPTIIPTSSIEKRERELLPSPQVSNTGGPPDIEAREEVSMYDSN